MASARLKRFCPAANVRSSQGTIAWFIALIVFPVITVPLYAMFGRTRFQGYREALRKAAADVDERAYVWLEEMEADRGAFTDLDAAAAWHRHLLGAGIDHTHELSYYDRKRIHNLKYFTWVEQQGESADELTAQWHDPDYWTRIQSQGPEIDNLIEEFNAAVAS